MAVGEKAYDESFDEVFLADDDLVDFGLERVKEGASGLDFGVDGTDTCVHWCGH